MVAKKSTEKVKSAVKPAAPKRKTAKDIKVPIVVFTDRTSENESKDVFMGINGRTIVVQRGIQVPVPQPFLDMMDNSKHPIFKTKKDGTRVQTAVRIRYPYSVVGETTLDKYIAMLRDGTAKTRQTLLG